MTRLVFGMSNSVVEWYRPGREIDADLVAQAVEAIVFGGLGPGKAGGSSLTRRRSR